jgi:nicotinamide mononucleotide transporter
MFDAIYQYFFGSALGIWELIATAFLIGNVYLLGRQKLINYWFGLVGVLIFGYIFYAYQLYSDMLLQWVFYAPLQVVGWYMWKYGKTMGSSIEGPQDSMKVVTMSAQSRTWTVVGILGGAIAMGLYMASNTDASFPYADALTTTMSVAASILMLKKVLESWYVWLAVDLIAIPIYYQKELYVTSGLYVIFLGLATYGLITWTKDFNKNRHEAYRRT